MPQVLVRFGYADFGFLAVVNMMEGKTDSKPGVFGIWTLYPKEEAAHYDMQLRELRNGRLAMLAYGGIATIAVLAGKVFPFLDATSVHERKWAAALRQGSAFCGGRQAGGQRAVAADVCCTFLHRLHMSEEERTAACESEASPLKEARNVHD